MFKIDPFVLGTNDGGHLPELEAVQSRFQLPDLEGYESSVNRLLDGLKFRATSTDLIAPRLHGSPKGKEKAVVEEEAAGNDLVERNDASFWLEAGENLPGPSKGRLFQVSSHLPGCADYQTLKSWDTMTDRQSRNDQGEMLSEGSVFTFEALVSR